MTPTLALAPQDETKAQALSFELAAAGAMIVALTFYALLGGALALGGLLLFPSFYYLFRVFKSNDEQQWRARKAETMKASPLDG